jgi:subtilisin family serine protease/membrane protease YdiL (CAAX protease family)
VPSPVPWQLLLFLLLLGWLVVVPVGVGIVTAFLPAVWPELGRNLLAVALLAGLLIIPFAALVALAHWRRWEGMKSLAPVLLGVGLYILVDTTIRAVAGPPSVEGSYERPALETILRFTLLPAAALLLGGVGLWQAGVRSRRELIQLLGLARPPLAGLLLTLAFISLLTLGWPLTGALGDRWTSQLILIQTLALVLPEELFFRGAVLGWLLYHFPQRRALAALLALLTYLAFTPSLIVPHDDWGKLVLLITALPLALLVTEWRLFTGSVWPAVLLVCLYRTAPLLFTDPRDELPFITQPWQTAARLWMIFGAGALALLLWLGRRWLARRWRPSALASLGAALALALLSWAVWLGLWSALGRPGFYDDGFLIIMVEQADLSGAEQIDDLPARRAFVRDRLVETAQRTQVPVRQALEAEGLTYRPFYLINMIRVEGYHRRMAEFASLPGVARVMRNPNVRPYPFNFDLSYGDAPEEPQGVEWNIRQVQADQVWKMGFTGQEIIVAGQDTGYDWQHPALRGAYRGVNGAGQVNHNYNWHDAWDDSPAPFDDGQHGTHTMGIILGDDGQGNQIGMAPGARWMGCRNMRRGLGNPASYTECMEFFLAPYPWGGDPFGEGDVSQAPHLINNSWGCPDIEGCDDAVLEPATAALRTAGIMMVVSAGNEGPACGTVVEPPAHYDEVFSVGATDELGLITGFSSRGPVPSAGTNSQSSLLKPDIAAPGDNIRSSVPGSGYGTASGTSMAGPHVTGLVALIWSANPALIGQIEATEAIIRQSATLTTVNAACLLEVQGANSSSPLDQIDEWAEDTVCACGGVTGSPNNVYGWGEIDALAAVKLALESR